MPGWRENVDWQHITRHREPEKWVSTWAVEEFTEQEKLQATAIHEAAHAVLLSVARVPVLSVAVRTYSELRYCGAGSMGAVDIGPYNTDLFGLCIAFAAGERAEERHLHETGKWTVERAWTIERHAYSDRQMIAAAISGCGNPPLTYGQTEHWNDLTSIHPSTDRTLDQYWVGIRRLADELVRHRRLTAEQVQDITKIPNPAVTA